MAPLFTVVLAAFNEERLIADAIRSVLAQTRRDFEFIVVDDGSADATAEVVESFPDDRIKLIQQANRGLAASLNTGAAAGSAPYIGLIDADDLWLPTYLERLHETLDQHPEAGFTYTDSWRLDMASGRFRRQSYAQQMGMPEPPPQDPNAMAISLMKGNWVLGLPLMRRLDFERLGGFEESLSACEDYELWLRFLASGKAAVRTPGRLVIQRNRSGSMSKDPSSMYDSLEAVYRRAAEEMPFPDEVRLSARQSLAQTERYRRLLGASGLMPRSRLALRRGLGATARAVLSKRIWEPGVPGEVASAFPGFSWRDP